MAAAISVASELDFGMLGRMGLEWKEDGLVTVEDS